MSTMLNHTDVSALISRDPSFDLLDELLNEEQHLVEQLRASGDPVERAGLYRRCATNAAWQAHAWERHPDRDTSATQCRHDAKLFGTAAVLEGLRAVAAGRGRTLPDPQIVLWANYDDQSRSAPHDALVSLYRAASGPLEVQ